MGILVVVLVEKVYLYLISVLFQTLFFKMLTATILKFLV